MSATDLRIAIRDFRARPAAWLAIVAAVGLSVAVAASLFSIMDGLLFRPLPFRSPEQLAVVDFPRVQGQLPELAYQPKLADQREALRDRVLRSPLISETARADVAVFFDPDEARTQGIHAQGIGSGFFSLFGLTPELGSVFTPEEWASPAARLTTSSEPLPVIIGHDLWQQEFGGDRTIPRVANLAGRPVRIVGVMAPGTKFPGETNVWAPEIDVKRWPPTYVRLAAGSTLGQLSSAIPELRFRSLTDVVQPGQAGAIPMLFGAGVLLLLVTWVQVAALMCAGAFEQLRDIGVRLAMGGSRRRLIRQFAVQGALAAGATFIVACLIVRPLTQFIAGVLPADLSRGQYLSPDLRTFLFLASASFAGFAILTLGPVVVAWRATPLMLLNRRFAARHFRIERVRRSLLVTQLALTTGLLYICGLAAHSYAEAVTFDYGFDADHVVVFTPPRGAYVPATFQSDDAAFRQHERDTVERLSALPAVAAATNFFSAPLGIANQRPATRITSVNGLPLPADMNVLGNSVGPDFLRVLGATLVSGRGFTDAEFAGRDDVMIVNETMARLLSPPIHGLGEQLTPSVLGLRVAGVDGPGEIIGVVKDFVDSKLDVHTLPQFFMPDRRSAAGAVLMIRLRAPVDAAEPTLRAALEPIWGPLRPSRFRLMRDDLQAVLAPYQAQSLLLGLIAMCCLPIAAIGLVGALVSSVRVRHREIAIRMALGAAPIEIRRRVVSGALTAVGCGLVIGVVLGAIAARLNAHQLFHVAPLDVVTLLLVTAGLFVLGWAAATIPARQASSVLPADLLREA
jgi:predicted permease